MRTLEIQVYKFEELDIRGQEKAISKLCEINVNHEWYEHIIDNAVERLRELNYNVSAKDIEWDERKGARILGLDIEEEDEEFIEGFLEDLHQSLNSEYEYLTSYEAIKDTIISNEYEFTLYGDLI